MQIKQWLMGLGALVTIGSATPALAQDCEHAAPVSAYPTAPVVRDGRLNRWEARRRHLEWLRWQREHARFGYHGGYRY
jgi:hypothetical protein